MEPPCGTCTQGDVLLDEVHVEAVRVWALLNAHARAPFGLNGGGGALRLEAMRAECRRSADPVGLFEKILLLESVLCPHTP